MVPSKVWMNPGSGKPWKIKKISNENIFDFLLNTIPSIQVLHFDFPFYSSLLSVPVYSKLEYGEAAVEEFDKTAESDENIKHYKTLDFDILKICVVDKTGHRALHSPMKILRWNKDFFSILFEYCIERFWHLQGANGPNKDHSLSFFKREDSVIFYYQVY